MKKIKSALKTIALEFLDQLWTIIALVIGWLVLEGSAKTMTANLVIGGLVLWIVTARFRKSKD
jgi:hypothetical protein